MKKYGHEVTDEVLKAEAKRIDENTKNLKLLNAVKNVFAIFESQSAYLKIYVLPVYVERVLYFDFFLKSAEIHERPTFAAKEFLKSALKTPHEFEKFAKIRKIGISELEFQPADWAGQVFHSLKPGGVFSEIIDSQESLEVIRLKSAPTSKRPVYVLQMVDFPKERFSPWVEQELTKIKTEK